MPMPVRESRNRSTIEHLLLVATPLVNYDPNPVRHSARCGTTMLAARLYAREATNHGGSNACLTGLRNYHHSCGWTCRVLSPPASHLR